MARSTEVDLTGGFKVDLKTLALLAALGASWYSQGSKIDSLRDRIELQEKSRIEVERARKETDDAKAEAAQAQQQLFKDALGELKAQLKLTALDVGDLKILAAAAKSRSGG